MPAFVTVKYAEPGIGVPVNFVAEGSGKSQSTCLSDGLNNGIPLGTIASPLYIATAPVQPTTIVYDPSLVTDGQQYANDALDTIAWNIGSPSDPQALDSVAMWSLTSMAKRIAGLLSGTLTTTGTVNGTISAAVTNLKTDALGQLLVSDQYAPTSLANSDLLSAILIELRIMNQQFASAYSLRDRPEELRFDPALLN